MPQVSEKYLEARKNKIAKAAINVFSKKGYSNASMKDIMDEAKVSRGGLYAHFKNIDSVFIAALKYDDSLSCDQLLVPNPKEPLLPQLKYWIYKMRLSIENNEASLVRAKSEFFLSHNVVEVPYLRERHEKLAQDIQLFISMGIKTGEFKNQIDVSSFSELIIAMIDGVMLHQYYQYSLSINLSGIFDLIDTMIENILS
ncbi:TetR family transcriptional regulator [Gottschalkia acidurici 9a]|uniref:TetR family transcriptional regulator n=1 Tax=Gottschalkia acidurici (strain ATCC 7906 / DSM 604 / BCRC 14475 / CIP 104303 / KCTC 5404 / NCIMB 10678 / 9a) TaxID=1128398 RepID=K0AXQ3_GOTA9|nr:TetR family transcriptional regulator [Gottschalkia acidurici]AFS77520.1 TetR family transcriptional regulator [Gottschalkia acidurici 9a]